MPSHHQSGFFRALAGTREIDLQVVFAHGQSLDRKMLGWCSELDGFPYRVLGVLPHLAAIRIALSQADRIHIVNGVWAERAFTAALLVMRMTKNTYAIYSEVPGAVNSDWKWKRLLKNTLGRWLVRGSAGALMVSHFAADYYAGFGLGDERIYPFGYFRSSNIALRRPEADCTRGYIEVIYVGQLIYRKGVDLLIEAMRSLSDEYPDLKLVLVGGGDQRRLLEQQVVALADRVVFEGVLPANEIPARIAQADVLVLPSRHDGWGVVVNEAFSVGVPVIASDRCGAADLIKPGVNGYIFRSGDTVSLRSTLKAFLDQRPQWSDFRNAAARTGELISAERVAPYFLDCVRHMVGIRQTKPVPPWLETL